VASTLLTAGSPQKPCRPAGQPKSSTTVVRQVSMPAMIAVDRLRRLVEQGLRIVEQQFDVLEERSSAATTPSIRSANVAT
jgi:hypothetical protein